MFEDRRMASSEEEERSSSSVTAGVTPPRAHSASSIPQSRRSGGFRASAAAMDLAVTGGSAGGGESNGFPNNNNNILPSHFGGMYSSSRAHTLTAIAPPPNLSTATAKFWDVGVGPPRPLPRPPSPPPAHPRLVSSTPPASTMSVAHTISSLSAASASASQFSAATNTNQAAQVAHQPPQPGSTKYSQLLAVLEEVGKDVRPCYAGSKSSAERLKRGIAHARILVREALAEVEKASKQ